MSYFYHSNTLGDFLLKIRKYLVSEHIYLYLSICIYMFGSFLGSSDGESSEENFPWFLLIVIFILIIYIYMGQYFEEKNVLANI